MTADESVSVAWVVLQCETRAEARYDDGLSGVGAIAHRLTAICGPELMRSRRAFHLPLINAELDEDEFENAIQVVEEARKRKPY
jgi:hypothetical protein